MRISDWSSDVCSSDLLLFEHPDAGADGRLRQIQIGRRVDETAGLHDLQESPRHVDVHAALSCDPGLQGISLNQKNDCYPAIVFLGLLQTETPFLPSGPFPVPAPPEDAALWRRDDLPAAQAVQDRKSTRLNSSH